MSCRVLAVLCRGLEKSLSERYGRSTTWARHGHDMACVNQKRSHYENEMGKIKSIPLAARHGRESAWARHTMCELALRGVIKRSFYKHPELSPAGQTPSQPGIRAEEGLFPWISQPGKHAGWDAMALRLETHTLENPSNSLSIVLSKNDVRLMSLKSLGPL